MAIPYVKQTWTDGAGGGTPVSAARLNVIEQGIYDSQRQPAARVYNSAAQSTSNATFAVLTFNSERFDTDTIHDAVSNTSRLTAKTAGVYLITAHIEWAANATGVRQIVILQNGTNVIAGDYYDAAGSSAVTIQSITTIWQMAVNDYVEVRVQQNSGGVLNVNASVGYNAEFGMVRIST